MKDNSRNLATLEPHMQHPMLHGVSENFIHDFQVKREVANSEEAMGPLRPSKLAGVSNDPTTNNTMLTALVFSLKHQVDILSSIVESQGRDIKRLQKKYDDE